MLKKIFLGVVFLFSISVYAANPVLVGLDNLFFSTNNEFLKNKKIGLITNHKALSYRGLNSKELFLKNQNRFEYVVEKIFFSDRDESSNQTSDISSYFIKDNRLTNEMLEGLDLLVYDIQTTGIRSDPEELLLYYLIEKSNENNISLLVLDRPNPYGGIVVEGPLLENHYRNPFAYIDTPLFHAMTIGELACYYNDEYRIGCDLTIIPMKNWTRYSKYENLSLEQERQHDFASTTTYLLGDVLQIVATGEEDFQKKIIAAPWINSKNLCSNLEAKINEMAFHPISYIPKSGVYKGRVCHGVYIEIIDSLSIGPFEFFQLVSHSLIQLHSKDFDKRLKKAILNRKDLLCHRVTGSEFVFSALTGHKISCKDYFYQNRYKTFLKKRINHLIY